MPTIKKQVARKKVTRRKKTNGSLLSKVTDIEFDSEGLKVALYGRSGTGKTTFWSTFPKPILAVVCSGGKRSGELRSVQNIKGIKKYNLGDTSEIIPLTKELEDCEYKTIVLDHATYLADLTLKEILGLDDIPTQKTWGIATQQVWGQVGVKMKEFLRSFLDLPQHVVIVAQEREFNTDNESELIAPYVGAALSPSVVGWLNPACDYIFQTFLRRGTEEKKTKIAGKVRTRKVQGGIEYCLRTGPDDVYTTKFRVPKGHQLPEVVVDPSYDKIVDILKGE